ncbi:alpha/beta hydrolase [Paenibacillus chungangensis]|uniref:Alpha/beta hydrolase n=1 Tax=Paenibacillus chungangensis TaxID=696535 RepID=A0ABW3HUY3_9BACL
MNTMITPHSLDGSLAGNTRALPTFPTRSNPAATTGTRKRHLLAAILASIAAMCLITVLLFHGFVAWTLAYPFVPPLASNPKEAIGLAYEEIIIPSHSGNTTVSGWYIPASEAGHANEANRTIVFSHGYGANREESWVPMYELTKLVHRLDYNVLLFDYGYASKEYKAPATGGREESAQLLAVVNYAKTRGAQEVVVWGFSMGAGTALQAALASDEIDAMILDSLFLPSPKALFDNLTRYVALPEFPSLPLLESMLHLWTGTSFDALPVDAIMNYQYDIPIFIVHGTNDDKAAQVTAETIAANQKEQLSRSWIVENGYHELLYRKNPKEYIQRAALFLSQVEQKLESEAEYA